MRIIFILLFSFMSTLLIANSDKNISTELYNISIKEVEQKNNFYLFGKWIFWQPLQDSMDLGHKVDIQNRNIDVNVFARLDNEFITMSTDFSSGLKVGFNKYISHDNWNFFGEYTYFDVKNKKSKSQEVSSQAFYGSLWLMQNGALPNKDVLPMKSVSSQWKFNLNKAVLDLGRKYKVLDNLNIRLANGINFFYIQQKVSNKIGTIFNNQDIEQRSFIKSNSWNLGPMGSINLQYDITRLISFIGNLNASILYSENKVNGNSSDFIVLGLFSNNINWLTNTYRALAFNEDFLIGLQVNNSNKSFEFCLLYEFQLFNNQNYMTPYIQGLATIEALGNPTPPGDLYLHGLTLKLSYGF